MPTYSSARGVKPAELDSLGRRHNVIVSYRNTGNGWVATWGDPPKGMTTLARNAWAAALGQVTALDGCLRIAGAVHLPLLWAYANGNGFQEYVFGYDLHLLNGSKIGHAAMIDFATISGEITQTAGPWVLDNESGAWGNMGAQAGKSNQLEACADELTTPPFCLNVTAKRAYSKSAITRFLQKKFQVS